MLLFKKKSCNSDHWKWQKLIFEKNNFFVDVYVRTALLGLMVSVVLMGQDIVVWRWHVSITWDFVRGLAGSSPSLKSHE